MRVSTYPARDKEPYLRLFHGALDSYGVETVGPFKLSPRWLWTSRRDIDAIHLHWAEQLWDGRREGSIRALAKLKAVLVLAGLLGIQRIWTVHNLELHENNGRADRWGQRTLARHGDLMIVHTEGTAERARRRLRPRAPIIVMYHGSYEGFYPQPRPSADVRRALGLGSERPVLCCVGRLREYKGLDVACESLTELGDEVQLVIAGVPHRGFDMTAVERCAESSPNVTLIARKLDDQEFVDLLSISDVVLLPYRQITGSGVLYAAWTMGCGVVASDLPYFREMVPKDGDAGRLFETGSPKALVDAVRAYLAIPRDRRGRAARAEADRYSWDERVRPVAEAMASWSGRTRRG